MFEAWIKFIRDPENIPPELLEIPEVKEAMDALTYMSADPDVRAAYQARVREMNRIRAGQAIKYKEGLAEGEKLGAEKERKKAEKEKNELVEKALAEKKQLEEKAKAEKKQLEEKAKAEKEQLVEKAKAEKIESAKKMLSDGLSMELISKYSGLSIEEVKRL